MGASARTAQLGSTADSDEPGASTAQTPQVTELEAHGSTASTPPGIVAAQGNAITDEHLFALHEVVKALSREKTIHSALRLIAEKARQLTRSASTALCRLDESRKMLDFTAVAGRGAGEMLGQSVRVGDALTGQTALTGEQILAYNPAPPFDLGKDGGVAAGDPGDNFIQSGGVRSAAIVPIFVNGISVGSLGAINRLDGESFTATDLLVLHILAGSAAVVIQQEGLRRQSAQKERERDILFETARTTSSTLNVQDILDGMLATIARSVDLFCAMVFLLNDEHTHLFIAADHGLTEEEHEIQLLAEGRLASAALSGSGGPMPILITAPETDPRYEAILPEDRARPLCWMVAPLVSREKQIGLIVVGSLQRHAYTSQDLNLLAAVAAPAAVAIENAELYDDATRRAEEATAIYELSQAVNTNLNLHHVLNFVADSVLALLKVDKFALYLYDSKTQSLEVKVARNIRRGSVAEILRPTRARGGIAWWVYEYETPAAVQNVAADHRNRSLPIDQEGVESLVSVPLQAGDEVIGVIHAMSSRLRSFTVGEMELLYTIANQVGVAISNIQILEATRQKSAELRRASRRVARALGTTLDPAQSAQTIVDLAAEIMEADRCLLYAIDPRGQLELRACNGLKMPAALDLRPAGRELSVQWVARKGRCLVIEDTSRDSRFAQHADLSGSLVRSASYIGMPLKIGSGVVGVLEVYAREPRSFPLDEVRQFMAYTAQAAVALQNAILVEHAGRRKQHIEMLAGLAELVSQPMTSEDVRTAMSLLKDAIRADVVAWIPNAAGAEGNILTVAGALMIGSRELLDAKEDQERSRSNPMEAGMVEESGAADRPVAALPMAGGELRIARHGGAASFDAGELQLARTVGLLLGPALAAI